MNAETFGKKEYADTVARVDFCRVCELEIGDEFMWQGVWFVVTNRDEKHMYYDRQSSAWRISKKSSKWIYKLGARSQQFVQVVKNPKKKDSPLKPIIEENSLSIR